MVDQGDIGGVIQRSAFRQQSHFGQDAFGFFVTIFGQQHGMRLFILGIVTRHFDLALAVRGFFADLQRQQLRYFIELVIQVGILFRLTGDNQRGTGFVDQDRVDFIDDAEIQAALHAFFNIEHHIVAQVVEAEFIIGTVGDVSCICRLLFVVRHLRQVDAGSEAEEAVQAAHPFGIALRQIVIDGNHMHALAGQAVQICRQRRHQGLAFTGAHFSDLAKVQDHAADQLHIEVTHFQHALTGFTANGKGFRQQIVQRRALFQPRLELGRLGLQLGITQFRQGIFERVDLAHGFLILLEQSLVTAAENLGQK